MSHKFQELVVQSGCSWASQGRLVPKDGPSPVPLNSEPLPASKTPFAGLTICVTGLSREARKQVKITTEKLGGEYSADLHVGCTHLVVQSCSGRKFECAMKHRPTKGLHVVTLSWFVNSARLKERLDESLYDATKLLGQDAATEKHDVCIPSSDSSQALDDSNKSRKPVLANLCFYIDADVSRDMQTRVVEACVKEGATCISDWYIGCNATHVICDEGAIVKYIGYNTHMVSPLWILKTVRERSMQYLVHISLDLVRHMPALLDRQLQEQLLKSDSRPGRDLLSLCGSANGSAHEKKMLEAGQTVRAAKAGIRRRRGPNSQPCRTLPRPITPSSMMESICWSISEPPSTAQFYLDCSESPGFYDQASDYFDAHDGGKEANEVSVRPLTESEKRDVVFKGAFFTILFPVDRFSELGPTSRCFFSEHGFTRQQILENVYSFYQELLSVTEVQVAIHTDSKHSERLRAVYAAPETLELGHVPTKRYEFLGSRRNFEGLRRLSVENTGQLYQLCLGSS